MTTDTDTKLEQLENNYQIHRVLESSGSISALVTDVGVNDDQVYVQFEFGESTYSLGFYETVDGYLDLKRLCIHTDVPFQSDLSELIGNTVSVEFGYDEHDNPEVYIDGEKAAVTEPKTDCSIPLEYPSALSEEIVRATNRIWHYKQSDDECTSAVINEVAVEGGQLVLTFHLCGEKTEWGVQVQEDFAAIEDSVYKTVVEEVGQGSVKNIKGSEIHIVSFHDLGSDPEFYVDLIDTIEDDFTLWGIFANRDEAELCRLTEGEKRGRMNRIKSSPRYYDESDLPKEELQNPSASTPFVGTIDRLWRLLEVSSAVSFLGAILFALIGISSLSIVFAWVFAISIFTFSLLLVITTFMI